MSTTNWWKSWIEEYLIDNQIIYNRRKESIEGTVKKYISEIFSYWPMKQKYYSFVWLEWEDSLWTPSLSELLEHQKQLKKSDDEILNILNSILSNYLIFIENLEKYKDDWIWLRFLSEYDIDAAMLKYKEKCHENIEELVSRVIEIFIKVIGTWDTWFLYQNAWVGLYNQIENEPAYSAIIQEWINIIKKHKEEIWKLLPDRTTLVDFWCCDGKKAWTLLDWIVQNISYLPVDVNRELLNNSTNEIEKLEVDKDESTRKITIKEWEVNTWRITTPIKSILEDENNNYTYFFTWWSIWNYEDETIKTLIWKIFKPKQWNIVFDYYKAPSSLTEIKWLLKCYYNEETKNWFMNWLKNLQLANYLFASATQRWWSISKVQFDEFFKFSVRYEFESKWWDKYYAELDWNEKVIIHKKNGNDWIICDEIPQQDYYPWKIVEWLNVIKDTSKLWAVYHPEVYEDVLSELSIAFYLHWEDLFNYFKSDYSQFGENWDYRLVPNDKSATAENYIEINKDDYVVYSERDQFDDEKTIYWHIPKILDDYIKESKQIFHIEHNISGGRWIPISRKQWEFIPIEISRRFSDDEIKKFLEQADRTNINIIWWEDEKFMKLVVASTKPK